MKQKEILGIQYLRAIAALAVVWDHAIGMTAFPKYFGKEVFGYQLFVEGALGVPLFFMISGFIIATVSLDGESQPKLSRRPYFIKRAIRILPIMWIAVLSYAFMRTLGNIDFDQDTVVRAMLLSPVGDMDPDNIWTLRHEAIFYIIFAITFLGKRNLRWLMAFWVLLPLIYALTNAPAYPKGGLSELVWNFCHPANLLFGAGLFIGLARKRLGSKKCEIRAMLPISLAWFCAVLVCVWIIAPPRGLIKYAMAGVLFFPLVYLTAFYDAPLNRFWKMMGDASFSIYLFHPHFESIALIIGSKIAREIVPVELAALVVAVIATVLSLGVYFCVELPITRLLRNVSVIFPKVSGVQK